MKMKNNKNMRLSIRLLSLVLAIVLPFIGYSLTSCTAQEAVDIAAGAVELALDVMEDTGASEEAVSALPEDGTSTLPEETPDEAAIAEDGTYDDRDSVALYIHTYGRLPSNYITKAEAQKLGWEGGSVERYAEGKCIGGSRFGNYEELLPTADGRQYYECDIDTLGEDSRGAKRLVYSNDGLIYYTDDHYSTFDQLY